MIPPGARVWIAMGHTDMRKGMQGLALLDKTGANGIRRLVQRVLALPPVVPALRSEGCAPRRSAAAGFQFV